MIDRPPIRATMTDISWPMRQALAAMVGGPMTWLNGYYTDVAGNIHDAKVIKALMVRCLARPVGERCINRDSRRTAALTDKGRWFAATALGEMADVLIMASARDAVAEARELMKLEAEG